MSTLPTPEPPKHIGFFPVLTPAGGETEMPDKKETRPRCYVTQQTSKAQLWCGLLLNFNVAAESLFDSVA